MFADDVLEVGATVGNGVALSLNGAADDSRRRYRDVFPITGTPVFYCDRTTEDSPNGEKREYGWGALTIGTPDTIVRNVLHSTEGDGTARVDWEADDEHVVYIAPLLQVLGPLLTGNMGALPAWAQSGFERFDATAGIATRLIRKLRAQGAEVETGRYHGVNGLYTAAMSMDTVDTGTSGVTIDDTHRDKFVYGNVTAADRTFTLGAVATYAKGFAFGVYGYGGANNVILTGNGTEKINNASGSPTTLNIAGGTPRIVRADHLRSGWIVHG